ncbi:hypothetical protein BU25DRAFT_462989 [Macroventuria anomochaeta]|uniref:Uncharacterized protein n=1 Tax=Macroventuria anomochaeta TaxID=301207 RepID=A0ACB6RLN5_9PLEO|nr:uncharacterized protein BU25DRAFT_462989 [Macroventuria anomochaeta]KAF2622227.1 hypothetical protein BU25DRAFT_462989 [Macroventuria anomochaeta]
MAITPAAPGLEVTIEVDNVALPEHQYEDEDITNAGHEAFANSVTKYLEVPLGAEFSIRWLLKDGFHNAFTVYAAVVLQACMQTRPAVAYSCTRTPLFSQPYYCFPPSIL